MKSDFIMRHAKMMSDFIMRHVRGADEMHLIAAK